MRAFFRRAACCGESGTAVEKLLEHAVSLGGQFGARLERFQVGEEPGVGIAIDDFGSGYGLLIWPCLDPQVPSYGNLR